MPKKLNKTQKLNRTEKLIENVSKFPTNLKAAFRLTAKQTKTTPIAISNMWYGSPCRKIRGVRDDNVLFLTLTKEGMVQLNTKNSKAIKETKKKLVLSDNIIDLKNMTVDMKAALLDVILG